VHLYFFFRDSVLVRLRSSSQTRISRDLRLFDGDVILAVELFRFRFQRIHLRIQNLLLCDLLRSTSGFISLLDGRRLVLVLVDGWWPHEHSRCHWLSSCPRWLLFYAHLLFCPQFPRVFDRVAARGCSGNRCLSPGLDLRNDHRPLVTLLIFGSILSWVRIDVVRFQVVTILEATVCRFRVAVTVGVPGRLTEVSSQARIGEQSSFFA